MEEDVDHIQKRNDDSKKIIDSSHPRRVVLAGPGTGKSYLFQEAIKKKREQGASKFLAITFIGKLTDELADDLAGLATTTTLHGFARRLVLEHCPAGWEYYPRIKDVIKEDLSIKGNTGFEIGDDDYRERTEFYRAVGDNDVVHYAVRTLKKDRSRIPIYDLLLVDEFQDFNEEEAELIDLLATKNEVLVVGDDDQALYEFKGSYSKYIREKHDSSNKDFESHTLNYCSRCTDVIIKGFHSVVKYYSDRKKLMGRVAKEYRFFPPDKQPDSDANPQVVLFRDIPPGALPQRIRTELEDLLKTQKIKSVMVLGEGRTCKTLLEATAMRLREMGFCNVSHPSFGPGTFQFYAEIVAGLRFVSKDRDHTLGWRLILELLSREKREKLIVDHFDNAAGWIKTLPADLVRDVKRNAATLKRILSKPASDRQSIADSSIAMLMESIVRNEKSRREAFIDELIANNKHQDRPLRNLDITVCNILGSKGLAADVVFLIGFDERKLPMKKEVEDAEVYQLLVAMTRAKKRLYFVNTTGSKVSRFVKSIDKSLIQVG